MTRVCAVVVLTIAAASVAACGGNTATSPTASRTAMSFFVSSATSTTGNIAGLRGADNRCQTLAIAAGAGNKTWRAYLSVEHDSDNGNRPTDARSRIGSGLWFNKDGAMVADGSIARFEGVQP